MAKLDTILCLQKLLYIQVVVGDVVPKIGYQVANCPSIRNGLTAGQK
jgi:hypothetical protein